MEANSRIAALRAALAPLMRQGGEIGTAASGVDAKLAGLNRGGGGGRAGGPAAPAVPGFSAIAGSLNHLLEELDSADMAPTPTMNSAYQGTCQDLRAAVTAWQAIVTKDLAALNVLLARNHVAPIPAPSPPLAIPACAGA
jgi:hypothetical protein